MQHMRGNNCITEENVLSTEYNQRNTSFKGPAELMDSGIEDQGLDFVPDFCTDNVNVSVSELDVSRASKD